MENSEKYLAFAQEIAEEAGRIMKKYYYSSSSGERYKKDNTIVTLADTEINEYLIKRVKETFPDHSVDGEEESFGKAKLSWVCDPVDGTAMYAKHVPVAVFSLALCEDGKTVLGIINDVFSDRMYYAVKGKGAYCNGEKISVNDRGLDSKESMAAFDTWTREYDLGETYNNLRKRTYFVHFGSFIRDTVLVANGDIEFAIFPASKHKNCDVAAAKVIVEEAGGVVTDLFGEEHRFDGDIKGAIVSNKKLYNEVSKIVKSDLQRQIEELLTNAGKDIEVEEKENNGLVLKYEDKSLLVDIRFLVEVLKKNPHMFDLIPEKIQKQILEIVNKQESSSNEEKETGSQPGSEN